MKTSNEPVSYCGIKAEAALHRSSCWSEHNGLYGPRVKATSQSSNRDAQNKFRNKANFRNSSSQSWNNNKVKYFYHWPHRFFQRDINLQGTQEWDILKERPRLLRVNTENLLKIFCLTWKWTNRQLLYWPAGAEKEAQNIKQIPVNVRLGL